MVVDHAHTANRQTKGLWLGLVSFGECVPAFEAVGRSLQPFPSNLKFLLAHHPRPVVR